MTPTLDAWIAMRVARVIDEGADLEHYCCPECAADSIFKRFDPTMPDSDDGQVETLTDGVEPQLDAGAFWCLVCSSWVDALHSHHPTMNDGYLAEAPPAEDRGEAPDEQPESENIPRDTYLGRLLESLAREGTGSASQLSRRTGIGLTSVYAPMEKAKRDGLVTKLKSDGVAYWGITAAGRAAIAEPSTGDAS